MKTWIELNTNKHPQQYGFKYIRRGPGTHYVLNTEHNRNVCTKELGITPAQLSEKGYSGHKDNSDIIDAYYTKNLTKFPAFDHQKAALKKANLRKFFAFFMEQGTGKTKTALDEFAILKDLGRVDSLLIICPNIARMVWYEQMFLHLDTSLLGLNSGKVFVNKETGKYNDVTECKVFITNYESILQSRKARKALDQWIIHQDAIYMITDESHSVKSIKAKQTKECIEIREEVEYIRELSGTPIGNSNEDLFSQFHLLSKTIWQGLNYFTFTDRYLKMGGFGGHSVIGHQNEDEIQEIMNMHSYIVKKEDCLDLPDKIRVRIPVHLSKKAIKSYTTALEEVKKQYTQIKNNQKEVNTLAISTKLRQLASGLLKTSDTTYDILFEDKVDATINLIKTMGKNKVLIWCEYRAEITEIYKRLEAEFPGETLYMHGGNSNKRNEILHEFEHSKRFLVVQARTASTAVTMNFVHTVINFSNSFNSIETSQKEDRCHRIGQKHNVTYYNMVTVNSADENVMKSLESKTKFSNNQLNGAQQLINDMLK